MIGLPCSKTVAQVSLMMNDPDARPHPQQKETSTPDEVTQHLNINHGAAHEINNNQLGFHKVSAR